MARSSSIRLSCPVLALVVAGCGGSGEGAAPLAAAGAGGTSSAPGGDASALPYAPCAPEVAVGGFTVELGADYTSIEGKVFDGVNPAFVPTPLASDGSCRLVTLPNLLCDPACPASTHTCAEGNQCVALPVARDVGSVSVSGLARPIEMSANASTGNYRPGPPALPHPGFEPGADLRLAASGGDYAPFELRGYGIAALQVAADPITVTQGQPVALRWSAGSAGPARINARLNINNHGSSNTWVECDFDDSGAAEIPAALVDGLIAQGASGFPSIGVARRTATSTNIAPGCVELLVRSGVELDVTLSGLVSCNTDDECPEGLTCKPVERFCE